MVIAVGWRLQPMCSPCAFGSPPPMSSRHRNLERLGGGMRQYIGPSHDLHFPRAKWVKYWMEDQWSFPCLLCDLHTLQVNDSYPFICRGWTACLSSHCLENVSTAVCYRWWILIEYDTKGKLKTFWFVHSQNYLPIEHGARRGYPADTHHQMPEAQYMWKVHVDISFWLKKNFYLIQLMVANNKNMFSSVQF